MVINLRKIGKTKGPLCLILVLNFVCLDVLSYLDNLGIIAFYSCLILSPSSALYSKTPLQQRDLTQHYQNLLKSIDIKLFVSIEQNIIERP